MVLTSEDDFIIDNSDVIKETLIENQIIKLKFLDQKQSSSHQNEQMSNAEEDKRFYFWYGHQSSSLSKAMNMIDNRVEITNIDSEKQQLDGQKKRVIKLKTKSRLQDESKINKLELIRKITDIFIEERNEALDQQKISICQEKVEDNKQNTVIENIEMEENKVQSDKDAINQASPSKIIKRVSFSEEKQIKYYRQESDDQGLIHQNLVDQDNEIVPTQLFKDDDTNQKNVKKITSLQIVKMKFRRTNELKSLLSLQPGQSPKKSLFLANYNLRSNRQKRSKSRQTSNQ
ncbi:UNKNOWN [Stylonychia lemnae]|uniref:Uncharacterized protein n=1 Tax=Stylonychia lemnae TaxID=5949 RepID=A0A078B9Z9_STYLE|nr:UNKNOWN [Stylonychia lemnae]|eukprot:CDW91335.1 UNKNOWN [Stylonychia lemnae]